MVRGLVRLVLIVVIVVAAAAFFLGYRWADTDVGVTDRPVGTIGSGVDANGGEPGVDTSGAREVGAEIGERVAIGANEAREAAAEAALTAKIKSKMALDDTIDAASIDVDTDGSVVTLTGRVADETARAKAVQLARETEGVTRVVDRLGR